MDWNWLNPTLCYYSMVAISGLQHVLSSKVTNGLALVEIWVPWHCRMVAGSHAIRALCLTVSGSRIR